MSENKWIVYLVRCRDGSLYCGVTNDMAKRLTAHNAGRGAKYTRSRRPVKLAAVSSGMSKSEAFRLEYRVKQQPASKKVHELKNSDDQLIIERLEKKLTFFQKEIKQIQSRLESVVKAIIL